MLFHIFSCVMLLVEHKKRSNSKGDIFFNRKHFSRTTTNGLFGIQCASSRSIFDVRSQEYHNECVYILLLVKGRVSSFWKPMLIFEITKTNTPLPQKGLAPILIDPPHIYVAYAAQATISSVKHKELFHQNYLEKLPFFPQTCCCLRFHRGLSTEKIRS